MTAHRGTTNTNCRGAAKDRRARKRWLLATFGDGTTAPCWRAATHCGQHALTFLTLTVDRIIPGCQGGTYRRGNIRPACARCNSVTGVELREAMRAARTPEGFTA